MRWLPLLSPLAACTIADGSDDETGDDVAPGGDLEVDCDSVASSAEVWLGVGSDVIEFLGGAAAAYDDGTDVAPPNVTVVAAHAEATAFPWGITLNWFGDTADGPGTFSCDLPGDMLLQSPTITYNDGTAMIWGARDVSPGSSCDIVVTALDGVQDGRVAGTFTGVMVGLNHPESQAFCGGFDTVITEVR